MFLRPGNPLPIHLWLRAKRVATVALLLLFPPMLAAEDIRLASMRLGTAWYGLSATLYKLMQESLPEGTRLEILAKGGGIANPLLVESGRAQVALANRATAVWAAQGLPPIYRDRPCHRLRALAGGLSQVPFLAVIRQEYLDRTGLDTLEEILGGDDPVRLVMKPKGSSAPVVVDMVLQALGSSREHLRARGGHILQVDAKQIPNVMRNDQADLYIDLAPLGQPTVTEVSLTVPVRFLEVGKKIQEALGPFGIRPALLPPFWKGQTGPSQSLDIGTILLARDDLPEEMAYLLTKTLCENRAALAKAHKTWAHFDPEVAGTLTHTGIPLHPGARRYYQERGWPTE